MNRFAGQVAVVTGGVCGLGLAIGRRLASEGASVVLWDIDPSAFDPVTAGFTPAKVTAIDVTEPRAVEKELGDVASLLVRRSSRSHHAGRHGDPDRQRPLCLVARKPALRASRENRD